MGFQEDEQNVVDYLATKFEGRMTCSVCGGSGIHYEGRVCVFRVGDDTNEVDLDAPVGLNLVQLVCPNCGHILHFNGTIAEGPWSAS